MNVRFFCATFLASALVSAGCTSAVSPPMQTPPAADVAEYFVLPATAAAGSRRVIYYYQTQYTNGIYVSLAPIWAHPNPKTGKPYTSDLIIAAFHLGYDSHNAPYIHLNDNPPGDPMFNVMWPQVAKLQSLGVSSRMMLGGAAQGSYAVLFSHWNVFYPILKQTIAKYKLNGIDLDVEETVSLRDIRRLIDRLDADFGHGFLITLAPVSSALSGGANLSGFDYDKLYHSPSGPKIAWFDAQFYSGFGSLSSTSDYDAVITHGYPPNKVVAGMIANPADGFGFVPIPTVVTTVKQLVSKYPSFGGVFAWEYFNAEPGGPAHPQRWAFVLAKAMGN